MRRMREKGKTVLWCVGFSIAYFYLIKLYIGINLFLLATQQFAGDYCSSLSRYLPENGMRDADLFRGIYEHCALYKILFNGFVGLIDNRF